MVVVPAASRMLSRPWAPRLALVLLAPLVVLGVLEALLRVLGYGYDPAFFTRVPGSEAYTGNVRFNRRFFPSHLARAPVRFRFAAAKPEGTLRIFVLGGSAAAGVPDVALGLPRYLAAMLRASFPGRRFEVVNAATVAINSHVVLPIARECAALEPDLVVVLMGNNEVFGPYGPGTPFGGWSSRLAVIRARVWLRTARTGQLLAAVAERAAGWRRRIPEWQGMEMFLDRRVSADDPRLATLQRHFRRNTTDICRAVTGAGAQVLLCTVPVNLRDCPPFAGDRAAQHFRAARGNEESGRAGESRADYLRARQLDELPFRAVAGVNRAIREIDLEGGLTAVHLVDLARGFERIAEAACRLPGEDLFHEHVHLNGRGNYHAAAALFRTAVALLPGLGAPPGGAAPPREVCETLLGLTDWHRYRTASRVVDMLSRPPFTGRDGHAERLRRVESRLAGLEALLGPERLAVSAAACDKALARSPGDIHLGLSAMRLASLRGDHRAAEKHVRRLVALMPHDAELRFSLATTLVKLERTADALLSYREALRLAPDYAEAHSNLGALLCRQGKHDRAAAHFRKAVRLRPRYAEAHSNWGTMLAAARRYEEAMGHYREAVAVRPDYPEAHNNLGAAVAEMGRYEEASASYREALRLRPDYGEAHFNLGRAVAADGSAGEALLHFREAARLMPQSADVHYALGKALAAAGDRNEALLHVRLAVRLRQGWAEAAAFLRQLTREPSPAPRAEVP